MKTHPCIITVFALAAAFLAIPAAYAASPAWTNNGIVWGGTNTNSGYYRPGDTNNIAFDGMPQVAPTTPLWTSFGSGSVTLDASNNFLNITTSSNDQRRFVQTNGWDASSAATIEFSIRINYMQDGAPYAGGFLFGNGVEYYSPTFGIGTNGYLLIGGNYSATATNTVATNFNTIRITLSGMESTNTSEARFYINNSPTALLIVTNFGTSSITDIRFGDLSATPAGQSGSMDWGYVSWYSGQAIPEPSTTALALGGLAAMAWYLRRRRRD